MKYLYFSLLLVLVCFLLSNSSGRAELAMAGNTGAPGDQSNGQTPITCQFCHNSAAIRVQIQIQVMDTLGTPVTEYTPSETYKIRVTNNVLMGTPTGYGFQLIPLLDKDITYAGGLQNPDDNVKISSIQFSNRTYAEHNNVSDINTFEFEWKAPAAGSGAVTFYSAGNGVNRNGSSSGDGASHSSLKILEKIETSTHSETRNQAVVIYPNPTSDYLNIKSKAPEQVYNITLLDLTGKIILNQQELINQPINISMIPAGVYTILLSLKSGQIIHIEKIIIAK
jgi:hypothetical protein